MGGEIAGNRNEDVPALVGVAPRGELNFAVLPPTPIAYSVAQTQLSFRFKHRSSLKR